MSKNVPLEAGVDSCRSNPGVLSSLGEEYAQMKVVAGLQKGRRLRTPTGSHLRPTSARVREALFAIVQTRVPGARVLDLYAGTGALGLEALSRGAQHVVFVESSPACLAILRDNIRRCQAQAHSTVIGRTVEYVLHHPLGEEWDQGFDLVFMDPPYHTVDRCALLQQVSAARVLAPESLIIVEHFHKHVLPQTVDRLTQVHYARYGDTALSFYAVSSRSPSHSCA
ncbi:MAG: 16S rRNA (guanine(966)-N(2))-methyltransferase RsmD [Nitrospirae bacterium]|nr:MAG: 16S rRNA (guanine(966)-N(2))-methyltransferase RsmD [Nitrospirota bacterium]